MVKKLKLWSERLLIVSEAYKNPNNIKPTACKYGVDTKNIRYWCQRLVEIEDREEGDISRTLSLKSTQPGATRKHAEVYPKIRTHYNNLLSMDRMVKSKMLIFEFMWLEKVAGGMGTTELVRKRIHRWCIREDIVHRRVTHIAFNTRYDLQKVLDFWVC